MTRRRGLLIGLTLIAGALGWWVLRVSLLPDADRTNASGYGQFVLAAVGLVIVLGVEVRNAFIRPTVPDLDELSDLLALAMRNQLDQTAIDRMLMQPAPLPIRWRRASEYAAGPVTAATASRDSAGWFDPLPGLRRTTAASLRSGNRGSLHAVYGGLSSGRVLILGGPGTGKSSAAILLMLDALGYREQASSPDDRRKIPIPVLFTLQGWDPVTTSVREWLVGKLTEVPLLRSRDGAAQAQDLLTSGRIAVFLDGLDEIREQLRPLALRALSEQATFRLVLLSREAELVAAAKEHGLTGAVALELRPLESKIVADYLLASRINPAPAAWKAIATTLTTEASSPVATALLNPLCVSLVRDGYGPADPVDELLDATRFADPDSITEHLLGRAMTAAYTRRPGQPPLRYSITTAHRTLSYLARRLALEQTRELAWWSIATWVPRPIRVASAAIVGAAVGYVVFVLVGIIAGKAPQIFTSALRPGLIFGFATGLAAGLIGPAAPSRISLTVKHILAFRPLMFGLAGTVCSSFLWLLDTRVNSSLASAISPFFFFGFCVGLLLESVRGVRHVWPILRWRLPVGQVKSSWFARHRVMAFGIAYLLTLGVTFTVAGILGQFDPSYVGDIEQALYAGLFGGAILSCIAAVGFGLMNGLLQPTTAETRCVDPVMQWRQERMIAVGFAFSLGLVFGVMATALSGPRAGLFFGVSIALIAGCMTSQITNAFLAQVYLTLRHRTPLRLLRFLEDARRRHIMRTVGAVYQFRHATLQDRLSRHSGGL